MGGLLGGGGDGIDERVAGIISKVFENYGIEPGELNKNINDTVELINELAPIAQDMQDLTGELEEDVDNLREEVGEFNKNSKEMSESIDRLADTLENFNEMVEEAAEEVEGEE